MVKGMKVIRVEHPPTPARSDLVCDNGDAGDWYRLIFYAWTSQWLHNTVPLSNAQLLYQYLTTGLYLVSTYITTTKLNTQPVTTSVSHSKLTESKGNIGKFFAHLASAMEANLQLQWHYLEIGPLWSFFLILPYWRKSGSLYWREVITNN